jgi:hypothetical protein
VLEARAELDSLEEIQRCPLVAARPGAYGSFFAAAPQLLHHSPRGSVAAFERALVGLLFPELPQLAAWAHAPEEEVAVAALPGGPDVTHAAPLPRTPALL